MTKTPNVLICGHLICHDCYQLGRPCTLCIDPALLLINLRSCSGSCQLNWVHNGLSGVITPTDGLIFTQGNTDYTLVYLSEDQVWMVEWDTKRALLFRNTPHQCGYLQLTLKSDLPPPATKKPWYFRSLLFIYYPLTPDIDSSLTPDFYKVVDPTKNRVSCL